MGAKLGVAHQNTNRSNETVYLPNCVSFKTSNPYFKSGTVVGGGLQLGINYEICDFLSLVLKGEMVCSGDWETSFISPSTGSFTRYGNTGPVLSYPVTVGMRFHY